MLAQLLERSGIGARVVPVEAVQITGLAQLDTPINHKSRPRPIISYSDPRRPEITRKIPYTDVAYTKAQPLSVDDSKKPAAAGLLGNTGGGAFFTNSANRTSRRCPY